MSGRSRDTHSLAVKTLPATPFSAGRRVSEEPRHTFTGGQVPAGKTALGRLPCHGGAATHVDGRSNPYRPNPTRQVSVSARRSRDTFTQVVKSLPARPHSAGRRVWEQARHTFTCGQIPAGRSALGRSPCHLGGALTHVHRRSNPCRSDRTWQVPVSARRSRDTRSQGCQTIPARSHLAGRRVREDPRHTLTGGQIPASETALGRSPCQGVAATHVHRRSNPTGHTALGRLPCQ